MVCDDKPLSVDDPAVYRIELGGALDNGWASVLGNLQIQVRYGMPGRAVTTLTGLVADQAALAGVLGLAYDLGMPLLSVKRMG